MWQAAHGRPVRRAKAGSASDGVAVAPAAATARARAINGRSDSGPQTLPPAEARARAEIEAFRKSETSPGVLLASGYIAGGSLAGVVAAFMEFSPSVKETLDFSKLVEDQGVEMSSIIAVAVFALLIVFALLVGMGKLFKPPQESNADS